MNYERMEEIAALIEQAPTVEEYEAASAVHTKLPDAFEMSLVFTDNWTLPSGNCLTVGCIAGWIGAHFEPDTFIHLTGWQQMQHARRILDLLSEEADILFTLTGVDVEFMTLYDVTSADAAQAIRNAVAQHKEMGTFTARIWDHMDEYDPNDRY